MQVRRLPDLVGLLLAFFYGLPSVEYAFGRDQAIFHYIGREWLAGSLPYRDAFDTKPPAIYLLHALLVALTGGSIAAIRWAELLGLLGLSWLAVRAVHRSEPRRPGELGLTALLGVSWYFTVFDYWDTGQVEFWEGGCLLAAYVVLEQTRSIARAALLGGLLVGVALAFKFTAALAAPVLAVALVLRAVRELAPEASARARALVSLRALGLFTLGCALPLALFVAVYALLGASKSLRELSLYLQHYASVWNAEEPAKEISAFWQRARLWGGPLLLASLLPLGSALLRRRSAQLEGLLVAWGLLAAALASVAVQRKYFSYHWAVLTPFVLLLGAYAIAFGAAANRLLAAAATLALVTLGFVYGPKWSANPALTYRAYVRSYFWPHQQGALTDVAFARAFTGTTDYNWVDQIVISAAIRGRMRPGDRLHVRGFELGMYALTGLSTPSRFPSEVLLYDSDIGKGQKRARRLHKKTLKEHPPRFFVSFEDRPKDLEELTLGGYSELTRSGMFVLFERSQ